MDNKQLTPWERFTGLLQLEKKDIIQEFITSEKHKDIGCLEIKENKA